jgi:hypothetical protein
MHSWQLQAQGQLVPLCNTHPLLQLGSCCHHILLAVAASRQQRGWGSRVPLLPAMHGQHGQVPLPDGCAHICVSTNCTAARRRRRAAAKQDGLTVSKIAQLSAKKTSPACRANQIREAFIWNNRVKLEHTTYHNKYSVECVRAH